jgi:hypothetical protein
MTTINDFVKVNVLRINSVLNVAVAANKLDHRCEWEFPSTGNMYQDLKLLDLGAYNVAKSGYSIYCAFCDEEIAECNYDFSGKGELYNDYILALSLEHNCDMIDVTCDRCGEIIVRDVPREEVDKNPMWLYNARSEHYCAAWFRDSEETHKDIVERFRSQPVNILEEFLVWFKSFSPHDVEAPVWVPDWIRNEMEYLVYGEKYEDIIVK